MQLSTYERVRAAVPKPVKNALRPILGLVTDKYDSEMGWWRNRYKLGGFENAYYKPRMLAMAGESSASFVTRKIVADFGCGPQGTLTWAEAASMRIGIDVLASRYAQEFDLAKDGMVYVTSTETVIPMPDDCVDVMFTLNALDHTFNLEAMCSEIVRVIKPNGELIGSFNLNEPATYAEPQTLTEELLESALLRHFTPSSVRFGRFLEGDDPYGEMHSGKSTYVKGEHGFLWFRGTKRPA